MHAARWNMANDLQQQHHGEPYLLVFIPYRFSLGLPKSDKFPPHGRAANGLAAEALPAELAQSSL